MPNRLDDLMGEAANVQQLSPEIVIGYVVLIDEAEDSQRQKGDGTWIEHFKSNLDHIAIRKAPLCRIFSADNFFMPAGRR